MWEPLFNTPHLAIALMDKHYTYIEVNEVFARTNQLPASFFPGKNHFSLHSKEYQTQFNQVVCTKQTVQGTGHLFCCPIEEKHKATYWEWSLSPVLDEQGEVELLLLSSRNVTTKIQAVQDLTRANENIAHILSNMSSGFYSLDQDFCFTYINKAAENHTKSIRPDDLLGKSLWDMFPLLLETEAFHTFNTAMTKRTTENFEFYSPYTGKWTDVYIYPSPQGVSVFFHDITTKKEAALALERSEQKFATVFNFSPTIKSIRCLETDRYIEVNEAWIKTVGYTREEVIGKTPSEMNMPVPIGAVTLTEVFKAGELPFYGTPRQFRTKSGGVREGFTSAAAININGKKCALVVTHDITEQRALEREMQRLDKLNVIGQMASGVGHEIRNPLTVVRGFLQLLSSKYPDSSKQFNIMISELDRANGIITEFLSLAKTKPDEQKLGSVNDVLLRIYPMLQAKALEFYREIDLHLSDIPVVLLSEPEMRQILLNLTINAIEASYEHTTVIIRSYCCEDRVIIAVTNKGPTIPPEVRERLGTPFFTTKDNGTGLGLAISFNLAKLHGGKIEVESVDNTTTFFIKLPIPTTIK